MMAALVESSPENRALDAISNLVVPRPPSPSDIVSTSPEAGTHLFPNARERARAVLISHEIAGTGTKTADSKMDQANNEVGMSIAEEVFKKGKRDDDAVCKAARVALEFGRLQMFDIDGKLIPTAGWRDLNPNTWAWGEYVDTTANPTPKQPRPRTRAEAAKTPDTPTPPPK
jgi:hypothetical protein